MNILKWLTKTANNTSVSRRSFLTGATTAAAVVAVPKLAEAEPVLKSCNDGISKSLFEGTHNQVCREDNYGSYCVIQYNIEGCGCPPE